MEIVGTKYSKKMKILKNNLWNRIFHSKELKAQFEKFEKASRICGFYAELNQELNSAKTLDELLTIHKRAWLKGFQNGNLDVCEYGMFRAEYIEKMTIDQVYLGNIDGLFTHNIRYWNQHSNDAMGVNGYGIKEDTKIYSLIMNQYRNLLAGNFRHIKNCAEDYVFDYNNKNYTVKKYEFD